MMPFWKMENIIFIISNIFIIFLLLFIVFGKETNKFGLIIKPMEFTCGVVVLG